MGKQKTSPPSQHNANWNWDKSKLLQYSNFFSLFFQKHSFLLKATNLYFLESAKAFANRITTSNACYMPSVSKKLKEIDLSLVVEDLTVNASNNVRNMPMPTGEQLAQLGRRIRLKNNLELARIAEADLAGVDSFATTVQKISALADAVIKKVFFFLQAQRFGLSVIAMGKLGGNELNYSSDIDLVFCTKEKLSSSESVLVTKLLQQFISLLEEPTDEGIAYRADLKIRPYGSVGGICLSHETLFNYYKHKASLWEWQALLKARMVVGISSCEELLQELKKHCIFHNDIPFSVLVDKIAKMKREIERNLRDKELKRLGYIGHTKRSVARKDVKLGMGGIRDIEFIVQFLQIYHSNFGIHMDARGTMSAIKLLGRRAVLDKEMERSLYVNYIFLRRVEHLLQLKDMLGKRNLPHDEVALWEIAKLLEVSKHESTKENYKKMQNGEVQSGQQYNSGKVASVSLAKNEDIVVDEAIDEKSLYRQQVISNFLCEYNDVVSKNRAFFEEIFKYSQAIQNKLNFLKANIAADKQEILFDHFRSLEGAYFLLFSGEDIARHVETLSTLEKEDFCSVTLNTVVGEEQKRLEQLLNRYSKGNREFANLEIISMDKEGMFSTLCGLASSFGMNIIDGNSFVYFRTTSVRTQLIKQRVYTRRENTDLKNVLKKNVLNEKRKFDRRNFSFQAKQSKKPFNNVLICNMKGFFIKGTSGASFNTQLFKQEVKRYLQLAMKGDVDKAMEGVLLRVARRAEVSIKKVFSPPEVELDNESDANVTVLRIKGKDYFLFLYFFTASLSLRGFNMQQVNFNTTRNYIENTFFITERNGSKITKPGRLQELHTTALIVGYFSAVLPYAPSPAIAFKLFHKNITTTENHAQLLEIFLDSPQKGKMLGRLLGSSEHLWEDFLRTQSQHLLLYMGANKKLQSRRSHKYLQRCWRDWQEELISLKTQDIKEDTASFKLPQMAKQYDDKNKDSFAFLLQELNRFKNEMLFEADLRFLMGKCKSLGAFCREISNIADVVFSTALKLAEKKVLLQENAKINIAGKMVLLALGKWGGREMGYASDLEMMLVYESDKENFSQGKRFYKKVVANILQFFPSKSYGTFEIDMRLRPDGESSLFAVPFVRFASYYSQHSQSTKAQNFERMALTRLRVVVGNKKLASKLVMTTNSFVYSNESFNFKEFYKLRGLQLTELAKGSALNLKYSKGGLVDIEYCVQAIIMAYGRYCNMLRLQNMQKAMQALYQYGVWQEQTLIFFASNYALLRYAINCLRIVRGDARDLILPSVDSLQFSYWYRRMKTFRALRFGILAVPQEISLPEYEDFSSYKFSVKGRHTVPVKKELIMQKNISFSEDNSTNDNNTNLNEPNLMKSLDISASEKLYKKLLAVMQATNEVSKKLMLQLREKEEVLHSLQK